MRDRRTLGGITVAIVVALGCLLARLPAGEARGGAGAPPPSHPNPSDPNQVLGAQLFDQCVHWVARGGPGLAATTDFHVAVIAGFERDAARPMRLWWKSPDKYREELVTEGRTTTKLLDGASLWILHPEGRVQRMHGTSEGAAAIAQLREDRQRMADLARFITLGSLRGPGVTFTFAGEKEGSGAYAGTWLEVTRAAPGVGAMHFWLAYSRSATGSYLATWPGIVRIDGDERTRLPTEDYVLRGWVDGRPGAYRYPREIEAFARYPGAPPARFLKATVQDLRINAGIPDASFRPPVPAAR